MKTTKAVLLFFVLATGVFLASAPLCSAQEAAAEAPEAGASLANTPVSDGEIVPGGPAGLAPDLGDFMENSSVPSLPKASLRRSFVPRFLPSSRAISAPAALPSAAESAAPQAPSALPAAVPNAVVASPFGVPASPAASAQSESAPAGPPPLPAGSLEDFLVNTQNGQTTGSPGLHSFDREQNSGKRGRKSLLQMLLAPLKLSASKAVSASAGQAAQMGRDDYDSHILGGSAHPESARNDAAIQWPRRPSARPEVPPVAATTSAATGHSNQVMVALSLDMSKRPGKFRDALADLSRTAMFKPAPGFAAGVPGAGMHGKIAVVGWLPRKNVSRLFALPSVARVRVDWNPDSSSAAELLKMPGASARMIIGLRIPAGQDPAEIIAKSLPRLRMESGFAYERTLGYRKMRGTKDRVLLVSGNVPLHGLSAAMGDAGVVSVAPVPPPPPTALVPARAPGVSGFLSYAARRSPGLVSLTALALVFSLAGF